MSVSYDFSLEITESRGCYNTPHTVYIKSKQERAVTKAITLKGFDNYKSFNYTDKNNYKVRQEWEQRIHDKEILLMTSIKTISDVNIIVEQARQLLNNLLELSVFEINVARELLEKEK